MKKRNIDWVGLIFGIIWLLMALLIFIMSFTGNLPASFKVPRFIGWLYDLAGVLVASIIQFLFSIGIIVSSVSRKKEE